MKDELKRFLADEEGATMVEYALMAVFIAAVCVVAVTNLGTQVFDLFQRLLVAF